LADELRNLPIEATAVIAFIADFCAPCCRAWEIRLNILICYQGFEIATSLWNGKNVKGGDMAFMWRIKSSGDFDHECMYRFTAMTIALSKKVLSSLWTRILTFFWLDAISDWFSMLFCSCSKHFSKSKSHYDWQSVGQSVLVLGSHLGPATNFSFSWRFSFRQLRFVIL
jgi:hypothetical protein